VKQEHDIKGPGKPGVRTVVGVQASIKHVEKVLGVAQLLVGVRRRVAVQVAFEKQRLETGFSLFRFKG
jgi:hypothetical protein